MNERTGAIKYNYPNLEIDQLPETCALDVADQAGLTLDDVGELLNLTRERVRQVEIVALKKVHEARQLEAHIDEDRDETKRRAFAWALKETA